MLTCDRLRSERGTRPWLAVTLAAGALAAGCGARGPLGVTAASSGAGGATASSAATGFGGAGAPPTTTSTTMSTSTSSMFMSTSTSTSSMSPSSSSSTGGPLSCATDADCPLAEYCWEDKCVSVNVLAAGSDQACTVNTAGGVQCWGDNGEGELGNGSGDTADAPVAVSGLASGIAGVAAGFDHECAWTFAGAVFCWGENDDGQLGDGTEMGSDVPIPVVGLPAPAVVVAGGAAHTCALTMEGQVYCWGANLDGQLGNGTTVNSPSPVAVVGLPPGIRDISAGDAHTCAITSEGGLLCWGWNMYGQLGNGASTDSHVPVAVSGLSSGVQSVSAGGLITCAVVGGGAQCWGANQDGELGDGSTMQSGTPVGVAGLSTGVVRVAAASMDDSGHEHACALTSAGGVLCWGHNQYGQLGNGSQTESHVPVQVSGLFSGVTAVSAGEDYTCAVVTGSGVQCWGTNSDGELGNGTGFPSTVPVVVLEP